MLLLSPAVILWFCSRLVVLFTHENLRKKKIFLKNAKRWSDLFLSETWTVRKPVSLCTDRTIRKSGHEYSPLCRVETREPVPDTDTAWGGWGGGGGGITPRVTHCKWRQRSNLHLISLQLDINRPVVTGQGEKGGLYCWEEIGDHWGGVRIGSHW